MQAQVLSVLVADIHSQNKLFFQLCLTTYNPCISTSIAVTSSLYLSHWNVPCRCDGPAAQFLLKKHVCTFCKKTVLCWDHTGSCVSRWNGRTSRQCSCCRTFGSRWGRCSTWIQSLGERYWMSWREEQCRGRLGDAKQLPCSNQTPLQYVLASKRKLTSGIGFTKQRNKMFSLPVGLDISNIVTLLFSSRLPLFVKTDTENQVFMS